jgi:hypothetical protein
VNQNSSITQEIAAIAARWVVEEGMEYGPAKRRAARQLGATHSTRRVELPTNEAIEDEVHAHLELFCADTQPQELAALRAISLLWMQRLAPLRPHLTGAVWRGTATRLNNVHLELFCDDSKQAELHLLDQRIDFDVGSLDSPRGGEPISVLSVAHTCTTLQERITLHLSVLDHDDLRGALKPDSRGRTWRGDLTALQRLMNVAP